MSPQRFPHLTDGQAREVAAQVDALASEIHKRIYALWVRMMVITTILVLGILVASMAALYVYSTYASKSDLTRAQAVELKDVQDLSLNNCLRSQDSREALRTLVNIAIPIHDPTRTAAEAARVAAFYKRLYEHHVLDVPSCKI